MSDQNHRSVLIGDYGPADWLTLKEDILDPGAQEREQILPLIAERARGAEADLEILDVASGQGRFTRQLYLASQSTRIIALDNYEQYLRIARERYGEAGHAPCIGNLYDLPFEDEAFDIVATRSTIDIMDGPRMFREMVRVLKPGVGYTCPSCMTARTSSLPALTPTWNHGSRGPTTAMPSSGECHTASKP
ncbi:class I SAM-dependent methyltransferase [Phytohabitans flavus]